jgi:hypothetical protein
MRMPKIAAVATATPPWRYDQATVLRMSGYDDPRRMGFFRNRLIEARHLYFDPATFTPDESVDQLNERWRRGAIEVGKTAVARAIRVWAGEIPVGSLRCARGGSQAATRAEPLPRSAKMTCFSSFAGASTSTL